eukprot:TRINITY_DN5142_c3_g3_i1.p1 TRINITY_DN5142_c3_g3~~TRINITY_DN5142_c3_g3_i1.p1  ORF type:complete len:461 (-),score=61.49 TRINITY_DN5142_c3_g3_i1:63-1445(-)
MTSSHRCIHFCFVVMALIAVKAEVLASCNQRLEEPSDIDLQHLDADDVCSEGNEHENCGLGLLQKRGKKTASAIETESSVEDIDKHPTWHTVILRHDVASKKGAFCLDGSAPGYYIEYGWGSGHSKWMFHLQGGGWCVDIEDCANRAQTNLGSSRDYRTNHAKNIFLGFYDGGAHGLLSNNCAENPDFCNWNKVYIRYCDGASYSGQAEHPVTARNGRKLYFRGRRVLDAILDDLLEKGMSRGTELLAKGCSAGGLGIWLNMDHIASRMPPSLKVKAMPECGFFMDTPTYKGQNTWPDAWKHVAGMQNVFPSLNKECTAAHKGEEWRCFMAQYTAPFVKTPHFVINSVYDAFQMQYVLGLPVRCTKHHRCSSEQLKAADGLRKEIIGNVSATVTGSGSGYFLYDCETHCGQINRGNRWNVLSDGKESLRSAFTAWYKYGKSIRSERAAQRGINHERSCFR